MELALIEDTCDKIRWTVDNKPESHRGYRCVQSGMFLEILCPCAEDETITMEVHKK